MNIIPSSANFGMETTHREIISLYFMRFICAAMIVMHHTWKAFFGYNFTGVTHYELDVAVDFFFILSGVMMAYIYPTIPDKTRFLLQRFARLWPVHLLTAGICLILFAAPPVKVILATFLGIQAFIPWAKYLTLNAACWCVCAEFFFYICYILGYKHVFKSLLVCILINAALFLAYYKYKSLLTSVGIEANAVLRFFPPARVFQFFAGCCVGYFVRKQHIFKSAILCNLLVIIGIAFILVPGQFTAFVSSSLFNWFLRYYYKTVMICIGIFLCCYPCTFLPKKITIFLGKISFAIFLSHQTISRLFKKYEWLTDQPAILQYIIYCGVVLIVGSLIFKLFEEPMYRLFKKYLGNIQKVLNKKTILSLAFHAKKVYNMENLRKEILMNKGNKHFRFLAVVGVLLCALIIGFAMHNRKTEQPVPPAPKNILFSMDIEAERPMSVQVFWTETGNSFRQENSVMQKVEIGQTRFEKELPTELVHRLRLDLGSRPGKVSVKNIRVSGKNTVALDLDKFGTFSPDIQEHEIVGDTLTIQSEKVDPYIIYTPVLDVTKQ